MYLSFMLVSVISRLNWADIQEGNMKISFPHPGIHGRVHADSPVLFNNHPLLSHTVYAGVPSLRCRKCQIVTKVKSAALLPAKYGFPVSSVLLYRLLYCVSSSASWLSALGAQISLNQEAFKCSVMESRYNWGFRTCRKNWGKSPCGNQMNSWC